MVELILLKQFRDFNMQNQNTFFPTYLLPPSLREPAQEMQTNMQAPPALIASSIFGALSIAGQSLISVQRPNGLVSPCSLFLIVIADSGERKTSCDKHFTKPIREFEANEDPEFLLAMTQYEADLIAWEIENKAIEKQMYQIVKKESENAQ